MWRFMSAEFSHVCFIVFELSRSEWFYDNLARYTRALDNPCCYKDRADQLTVGKYPERPDRWILPRSCGLDAR